MFKKCILSALFLLTSFSSLKAQSVEIPQQFFVKQHWFSLTNTFDVETQDRKFGTVHRKLFSWNPHYIFYDINEQIQAKAKMRFFSLGATFDIYDAYEQPIGKVEERFFAFFPTFDLYRADGHHVAKARLNFWQTRYTVKDPATDQIIAFLSRGFFRLKDNWTVDIVNPTLFLERQIDPRFFILVMAFQTDRDYWASYRYSVNGGPHIALESSSKELINLENKLEPYRITLESHRAQLQGIEPSDAEIESLENIVEKRLNEYELTFNPSEQEAISRAEVVAKGISQLLPLLHSEELSLGQKSALFLLLEQELN